MNQTIVRYPVLNICNSMITAINLFSVKNSFMLASPSYPKPYPRNSTAFSNCSLNVSLSGRMQLHLALVDLDLVSTGVWPPAWQQRLLAYQSTWSTLQIGKGAWYENSSTDTNNCTGENDILRVTSSKFALAILFVSRMSSVQVYTTVVSFK